MNLPYYEILFPEVVQYDYNKLLVPSGDSTRLVRFFAKLDSMLNYGNGNLNIVHIGGSHVQADAFSNNLRMHFADLGKNIVVARGAIFPWSAAKTNGPKNLETSYTGTWQKTQNSLGTPTHDMGIMGYSITTNDTNATISFNLNPAYCTKPTCWCYDRLRLFADINDSTTTPLLEVDNNIYTAVKDGDSYRFNLPHTTDHGTIRFLQRYEEIDLNNSCYDIIPFEVSIEGLIPENDNQGIVYHSLGVNGASVKSWLKCTNLEKQLQYITPDLLICGIGINDANVPYSKFDPEQYKENYRNLLQKVYDVNPDCAVIFLTNNDCVLRLNRKNKGTNKNTPRVEQALMELAAEQNAAVWNQYMIMGGLGSSVDWVKAGLMTRDRVHFTANGYNVLGNLLFDAIMDFKWNY